MASYAASVLTQSSPPPTPLQPSKSSTGSTHGLLQGAGGRLSVFDHSVQRLRAGHQVEQTNRGAAGGRVGRRGEGAAREAQQRAGVVPALARCERAMCVEVAGRSIELWLDRERQSTDSRTNPIHPHTHPKEPGPQDPLPGLGAQQAHPRPQVCRCRLGLLFPPSVSIDPDTPRP